MTHLEAEAVIPLPADEYWSIRNSEEFYRIECEVLGNASKVALDEQYNVEGLPVRARLATKPDISFVPQYLRNMLPTEDKTIIFFDEIEYVCDDPLTPYAFKYVFGASACTARVSRWLIFEHVWWRLFCCSGFRAGCAWEADRCSLRTSRPDRWRA